MIPMLVIRLSLFLTVHTLASTFELSKFECNHLHSSECVHNPVHAHYVTASVLYGTLLPTESFAWADLINGKVPGMENITGWIIVSRECVSFRSSTSWSIPMTFEGEWYVQSENSFTAANLTHFPNVTITSTGSLTLRQWIVQDVPMRLVIAWG